VEHPHGKAQRAAVSESLVLSGNRQGQSCFTMTLQSNEVGSAQGNIISPVLANIYMHHVLVLWYKKYFEKQGTGESFLVVYADDCLAGFEEKSETERYYEEMQK